MGISALTWKFFRAEIRKLLLIIGLAVSIIIVFQCFALPYGKIFSSSSGNKNSVDRLVLKMEKSFVNLVSNDTNGSDSEEDTGYGDKTPEATMDSDLVSEIGRYIDGSFRKFKDQSSHDLTSKQRIIEGKSLMPGNITSRDTSFTQSKAAEILHDHSQMVEKEKINEKIINDNDPKATTHHGIDIVPLMSAVVATEGLQNLDPGSGTSGSFFAVNLSSVSNAKTSSGTLYMNSKPLQIASEIEQQDKQPISLSQMNSLYLYSINSSRSSRPRQSSVCDLELLSSKHEIENAHVSRKIPLFYASIYQNISKFQRSYEMMERTLKVYVYKEGAKPIFHQPKLRGIYASEGWFMKLIEGNKKFVVRNPRRAHLFYLPFSSIMLRTALAEKEFQNVQDLQKYLKDYIELIAGKYGFWNRTGGADHFLVACHDWAIKLTKHLKSCLRALCNSNTVKGFKIGKDTTLPVTYIRSAEAPLENLGGKPPSDRHILAFFAGGMHGYLRPIILEYWQNKEPDMKIFGSMPRDIEGKRKYRDYMKSSKYCICARGYEVHTPRVVEAIYYECVPVIISDNYVPPFFEVLNWEAFAVFVRENDIPNLRNILLSIPEEKYLEMHSRVKLVQQHFLWHKKPVKYDLFHMILHSVWYNRVAHIKTR